MNSTQNPGRVTGFLYLFLVAIAPFRLIYLPSTLFVSGNDRRRNPAQIP